MDGSTNANGQVPAGFREFKFEALSFNQMVGPLYIKRDGDNAVMGFRIEQRHCNPAGVAHGGMLMTFADMAWGNIVSVETSSYWVTVRLLCDFLSSAKLGDWVEGGGEALSQEGDLFMVRGRIWSGERTLMTGTGVFKPLQRREPRPGEKAYRDAATV